MGNISTYLQQIMNAVYGEQVRSAIHDAINQCYIDASAGITPTITVTPVDGGTRVDIAVGADIISFVVQNGTATTQEVQYYVTEWLEENPDFYTTEVELLSGYIDDLATTGTYTKKNFYRCTSGRNSGTAITENSKQAYVVLTQEEATAHSIIYDNSVYAVEVIKVRDGSVISQSAFVTTSPVPYLDGTYDTAIINFKRQDAADLTAMERRLTLFYESSVGGVALASDLDDKVDKVTGKGLSTEDYTTAEKTKLAGLTQINVDDTLSVEGRAADAKVTGDEIKGVKDAINPLYDSDMEQGSFSTVNYGFPIRLVDNATRIRSKEMYAFSAGKKVVVKNGYLANLFLCDSNGGYITNLTWAETATSDNTTATKTWVIIKKSNEGVITADEAIDAILYSDFPLISIQPKANEDDLTALEAEVSTLENNISEFDSVRSTLCVYNNVPVTLEAGVYDRNSGTSTSGKHATVSVASGERYIIVAGSYNSSDYPIALFRNNGAIVGFKNIASAQMVQTDVVIPDNATEMIINTSKSYIELKKGEPVSAKPYSKWHGKKIAWFGTSIPETSSYNAVLGYPEYVGKLLGAQVYNEAVGSSCARRGFKSAESESDPYGWTGMGYPALWNMGATIAEKTELLTDWESKWKSLTGVNAPLTEAQQTKALNCSYENKLLKYVNDTPVDLYVFDHGYNDWSNNQVNMAMNENDPYDRSTFQGAMNTFIKAILEFNPRAKIVIISHYESQERAGLIEMQDSEAKYWNLPFCKLYEGLGWANDRSITTNGYWSNGTSNGVWIESGGTSRMINLKQYHMPDGRHPNIDISGHACMDIAEIISDFIDHITPSN